MGTEPDRQPAGSVIIPAHNEAAVLGRLLSTLTDSAWPSLDVVVVCNGCQDDTADVARSFGVRVIETPVPSKINALRLGDTAGTTYPRLYADADVEIDRESVQALLDVLADGALLAAGPRRVLPMTGVSTLVRAYYGAWEQLPAVRSSLWGRGVIGFSEAARELVASMPNATSDDLALSLLFSAAERTVVQRATVVVHPPRTMRALLLRKERSVAGNRELSASGMSVTTDRTTPHDLVAIARTSPRNAAGVVVLALVSLVARLRARRHRAGHTVVWGRDETSRVGATR